MVTLDDFIRMCREDTARWFPQVKDDLAHMVLALNEEAGEVAGALKKGQRGSIDYEKALRKIADESVDVLIYLCNIWGILGIDPVEVFNTIRIKNEKRFGKNDA
jgi:NTP pyrophosphatase (non-canonical NTP hydrolase)